LTILENAIPGLLCAWGIACRARQEAENSPRAVVAIRRFLLYDVLLDQIGHLQIIDANAKGEMRKFAREPKAQEFAMFWCVKLWSQYYDHPDPVHNRPTKEELNLLNAQRGLRLQPNN